jgi:NIMA (never in mitosis gene a)-related kinase
MLKLRGFVEGKIVGQGTYGSVYKARRESDGIDYAVKVIDLAPLHRREIEDSVNEIRLMASFTSPFIVRFYEAFCDQKRLYVVTEYARLGDLAHLIERRKQKRRPLQEEDIWRYMIQLLQGLKSLHACGVVHRDLKSANILIAAPDLIKIADLGISTVLHTTQLARTQIGTPLYIAPEVWRHRPYDHRCDIWSLGVILYEMMTFAYPFNARSTTELAQRICVGRYAVPHGYSPDLIGLLRRLLQVSPAQRPTAAELLCLQCIQTRANLVIPCVEPGTVEKETDLLSPIRVPANVYNVHLPSAAYNKRAGIVKPIEQRLHVKKGIPIRKDMNLISSPELQLITDFDWWSPTGSGPSAQDEPWTPPSARPIPRATARIGRPAGAVPGIKRPTLR